MKKILVVLLALVFGISLVSCSSDNGESKSNESTKAEDFTVGFIYVGPIGDGGYTYAHDQGRLELEKELGVKTLYKESVAEDASVKTVIANMIDQGAKVIIGTSFGYMDYMVEMSKEYPDVKFLHCSGYKSTDNMNNFFGRMYEPRYLSGIVAGMKTKTNKIGYVAAFEIAEVIRGINAFTLGVQAVNPDAEVEVVWTHTWYDPAKEKEAAVTLLDAGADIIAQHQDTPGPLQAADEAGKFGISYNVGMENIAPNAYLTAPIWNWGGYYISSVKAIMEGTWKNENYWGHMSDNVVKLDTLSKNVEAGTQEKIDEYTNKLISNEMEVFSGPIYDQDGNLKVEANKSLSDEELLNMKWFVKGVKGKIN